MTRTGVVFLVEAHHHSILGQDDAGVDAVRPGVVLGRDVTGLAGVSDAVHLTSLAVGVALLKPFPVRDGFTFRQHAIVTVVGVGLGRSVRGGLGHEAAEVIIGVCGGIFAETVNLRDATELVHSRDNLPVRVGLRPQCRSVGVPDRRICLRSGTRINYTISSAVCVISECRGYTVAGHR